MKQIKTCILCVMTINIVTASLCHTASAWATLLNPNITTTTIPAALRLSQLPSGNMPNQINIWQSETTNTIAANTITYSGKTPPQVDNKPHTPQLNTNTKIQIAPTDSSSRLDTAWKQASLMAIDSNTKLPEIFIISRFDMATAEKHSLDMQVPTVSLSETDDTADNSPPGSLIFLGLGLIGLGLARRAHRHKTTKL